MSTTRVRAIIAFFLCAGASATFAQITDAFAYQGVLNDANGPTNAPHDLIFRVLDAEAGGSQIGQCQCFDNVIPVDGVFSVILNDAGQFGPTFLDGSPRWLEVRVRADATLANCPPGCGAAQFETLAPRQRLLITPYAGYSRRAPWTGLIGVPPGFLDGIDDAGGLTLPFSGSFAGSSQTAFSMTQTGTGSAGLFRITNPASFWEALTVSSDAGTGPTFLAGNNGGDSAGYFLKSSVNPSSTAYTLRVDNQASGGGISISAYVGPGVNANAAGGDAIRGRIAMAANGNPGVGRAGYFEVNNSSHADAAVRVLTNGGSSSYGLNLTQSGLGFAARIESTNASNTRSAVIVTNAGSGPALSLTGPGFNGSGDGGVLSVFDNSFRMKFDGNSVRVFDDVDQPADMYLARDGGNVLLATGAGGNVGIGTTAPSAKLHVGADGVIQGRLAIGASAAPTNASLRVAAGADNDGTLSTLRIESGTGPNTQSMLFDGNEIDGMSSDLYLNNNTSNDVILVNGGGQVGIGVTAPAANLDIDGVGSNLDGLRITNPGSAAGVVRITSPDGSPGIIGEASNGHRRDIRFQDDGIALYTRDDGSAPLNGNGIFIDEAGNVGIGNVAPTFRLEVNGITRTDGLIITGGADLSEGFEITGDAAQPGAVVVIDPRNPGHLTPSTSAYDKRVAGVVSGAGGVSTGLMMSQPGSAADGKHPVALTGRVYCLCDASFGAIEPGDLLTTSATAGHAMRVGDHDRAPGAVLGKAMTRLESGRGLVLVLVSLQ